MVYKSLPCNVMVYNGLPCNTMYYNEIPRDSIPRKREIHWMRDREGGGWRRVRREGEEMKKREREKWGEIGGRREREERGGREEERKRESIVWNFITHAYVQETTRITVGKKGRREMRVSRDGLQNT